MIDTDKYEGYTPAPWQVNAGHDYIDIDAGSIRIASVEHVANAQLIADAPLILEEVKRLNRFVHCAMNFMSKHDLDYQFLSQHGVYTAPSGGAISVFTPYSYKWDDETKVSSEPIEFTVRGEEE